MMAKQDKPLKIPIKSSIALSFLKSIMGISRQYVNPPLAKYLSAVYNADMNKNKINTRGAGRPPLPAHLRRGSRLEVRVTAKELAKVRAKAGKDGMSHLIRRLLGL